MTNEEMMILRLAGFGWVEMVLCLASFGLVSLLLLVNGRWKEAIKLKDELLFFPGLIVANASIRDLQAFPEADQQGTVVLRVTSDSPSFQKARADLEALFGQITNLTTEEAANG